MDRDKIIKRRYNHEDTDQFGPVLYMPGKEMCLVTRKYEQIQCDHNSFEQLTGQSKKNGMTQNMEQFITIRFNNIYVSSHLAEFRFTTLA